MAASARVQMENWGGGATHSNQELEIDVSGPCVTFQATRLASAPRPPPMAGPVCSVGHQRQRQKNFQVGPRRLPPHPSRTTWSCSIWLPREEPLPRNNLHSKDLEGASGKERGGWTSCES